MDLAAIESSAGWSHTPRTANAQAVLENSMVENSDRVRRASAAIALSSGMFGTIRFAKAHAVFARVCVVNSRAAAQGFRAAAEIASSRGGCLMLRAATAHASVDMLRESQSCLRRIEAEEIA
mmetsp:Transcript_110591/g.312878  ORF Transcript_110591/g.312878 Transcript_110591/m.312878 type:complete len:122 (-) Transcript_110591:39-404(-)